MTEAQVQKKVGKELSKLGYAVYTNEKKQFIFALPRIDEVGLGIPVLLVAHTDTVGGSKGASKVFHDEKNGVMWSPEGLGADDRAGVFAVIELAKRHKVSVLLTTGEESGGIGARAFIAAYPSNEFGYKMAIQLDRRGDSEVVFYQNDSEEFQEYIQEFGFKKDYGSFSDISIIGPAWRINSANLSVGFVREHSNSEHLFVDSMIATINKVSKILAQEIPNFDYEERTYSYSRTYKPMTWFDNTGKERTSWIESDGWSYTGNNYRLAAPLEEDYDDNKSEGKTYDQLLDEGLADCHVCGNFLPTSEVMWANDDLIEVCLDCYNDDGGFYCGYCDDACLPSFCEMDEAVALSICDKCYYTYYLNEIQLDITKRLDGDDEDDDDKK